MWQTENKLKRYLTIVCCGMKKAKHLSILRAEKKKENSVVIKYLEAIFQ